MPQRRVPAALGLGRMNKVLQLEATGLKAASHSSEGKEALANPRAIEAWRLEGKEAPENLRTGQAWR